VYKPKGFHCIPMQIDTWNRDFDDDLFHLGPLPSKHGGPQDTDDLISSPLTECPCSDRLFKVYAKTFTTRMTDSCDDMKVSERSE